MCATFLSIIFAIIFVKAYNCDFISELKSNSTDKVVEKSCQYQEYCNTNLVCVGQYQVCYENICYCKVNYQCRYEGCYYYSCDSDYNCWNYDRNRVCISGSCVCTPGYTADNTEAQVCRDYRTTTIRTTTLKAIKIEYPLLWLWIALPIVIFILIVTVCVWGGVKLYRGRRIVTKGGIVHTLPAYQVQSNNEQNNVYNN